MVAAVWAKLAMPHIIGWWHSPPGSRCHLQDRADNVVMYREDSKEMSRTYEIRDMSSRGSFVRREYEYR